MLDDMSAPYPFSMEPAGLLNYYEVRMMHWLSYDSILLILSLGENIRFVGNEKFVVLAHGYHDRSYARHDSLHAEH